MRRAPVTIAAALEAARKETGALLGDDRCGWSFTYDTSERYGFGTFTTAGPWPRSRAVHYRACRIAGAAARLLARSRRLDHGAAEKAALQASHAVDSGATVRDALAAMLARLEPPKLAAS